MTVGLVIYALIGCVVLFAVAVIFPSLAREALSEGLDYSERVGLVFAALIGVVVWPLIVVSLVGWNVVRGAARLALWVRGVNRNERRAAGL